MDWDLPTTGAREWYKSSDRESQARAIGAGTGTYMEKRGDHRHGVARGPDGPQRLAGGGRVRPNPYGQESDSDDGEYLVGNSAPAAPNRGRRDTRRHVPRRTPTVRGDREGVCYAAMNVVDLDPEYDIRGYGRLNPYGQRLKRVVRFGKRNTIQIILLIVQFIALVVLICYWYVMDKTCDERHAKAACQCAVNGTDHATGVTRQ